MQRIAEAANVSRMTVSLALRESPLITKSTREHVQRIANKLGYRPNPLVSTLMAARAGGKSEQIRTLIALLDPNSFTHEHRFSLFYQEILEGIQARASQLGFSTDLFPCSAPEKSEGQRLHRILFTRNIRGILVLPGPSGFRLEDFPWQHYAGVSIGSSVTYPPLHQVTSKQYSNALLLYDKLHSAGYRRLGLVIENQYNHRSNYNSSAALYSHAASHKGSHFIEPHLHDAPLDIAKLQQWISRKKPDVIISNLDLRESLSGLGLQTPQNIGLASLNLIGREGTLTGVHLLPRFIGASAVDQLSAALYRNDYGLPIHPTTLRISGVWHQGHTTHASEAVP